MHAFSEPSVIPAPRILVITELFLPTKGGTAVWFDEVYRRIGGKSIHILTADVPGSLEHDRNHPNSVHRLSLTRTPWLRPESLAMYAKLLGKGLILAVKHGFEQIHTGRVLPEGLVGLVIARLFRRPLVIYAHGEEITSWRQPGKFQAMAFTFRHADLVIANSEFTRDKLLELGVKADKIAIIYPGVDTERFKPGLPCDDLKRQIGLKPDQKLILSVGRLSRRKGFDMVIRSLPQLLSNGIDAQYALIGIGEDRDYLKTLAQDLGVANRVHMLGHVAPEDLPRWYNACDVFAMPNRDIAGDTEGFGMVYIEAGACGKPAIAGQTGGTGAAVEHGLTGLRVNGDNPDDVFSGIKEILDNPSVQEKMGSAALKKAVGNHDWAEVAKRTTACCQTLFANAPQHRTPEIDRL
ncbi:glycosyltransferase family 4 protein [Methylocaldum sp.]|uniref:glycosyltransferase family 4 protein n=1 Tax=Methylocaldum sp. TaxID=1969727 RepID=UPI002D6BDCE2|nr:glycosyltransferase family 4 protein [Methylocaldum sp.]HYE37872.1 glycosyltransferase family 4 protein [Methylocaldum sp.]